MGWSHHQALGDQSTGSSSGGSATGPPRGASAPLGWLLSSHVLAGAWQERKGDHVSGKSCLRRVTVFASLGHPCEPSR